MSRRSKLVAVLLAAAALAPAHAVPVNLLDLGNRLIRVDSTAPGTITSTVPLLGLPGNEQLLGIDYRPASPRVLYGLSTAGRVYAINPLTGTSTPLGAAPNLVIGTSAGVDFNPSVDRIRVVTNANQNIRLNPDTGGLAGTDTSVAFAATDINAGKAPRIVGAAYTNNVAGGTPTTLYVLDTANGVLATQGSVSSTPVSPNTGQLFTVGATGVASTDAAGFDIGRDGTVLASFTSAATGTTSLYGVNLATGAATLIGQVGATAGRGYLGLAIAAVPAATFGATANQVAVGTALDNFVGVPSAGLNALFTSFDGLSGGQSDALSQLTPGAYTLLPEVTLRTAEFQSDTVQRYLRDFRDGATGARAGGDSRIGAFLIGSGREGRYDADIDRPRVEYGAAGVIGGIDYRISEDFLIGAMGGYDDARVRLGGNIRNSEIQSWFAGGYGTFAFGPAYIDLYGSYGKADYDLRRAVRFGTTDLAFGATTESETWIGGGTVGVQLKAGGFVIEPFAGVRYARLEIDAFSEGSTIAALTLGDVDYESITGNFGAKAGFEFGVGNAVVRPEIRGAYRREFKDDRFDGFGYGFAGTGSTTPLGFTPTALRRNYYTAGAGFTVSGPASPLSLVVDYNGEFAKDRRINGITGGLRLVF